MRADGPLRSLGGATLRSWSSLAERFRTAEPCRHVVVPDFLQYGLSKQLRAELSIENKSGGALNELNTLLCDPLWVASLAELSGVKDLHADPDQLGAGVSITTRADFWQVAPHPKGWRPRLGLIVNVTSPWVECWDGRSMVLSWFERVDHRCLIFEMNPADPLTLRAPADATAGPACLVVARYYGDAPRCY